ncbi:hypothetical protein [Actinocorallia populi]|uniref:hypothetical protein n=1 Tax=Actinocorallia populi TaxID=2079200 RepID=UPI000D091B40|nr:hypothetical protein [Actinocorallia populi]
MRESGTGDRSGGRGTRFAAAVAAAVALTAVPAAVLTVPNVITLVAASARRDLGGGSAALVQAAGAALPALVLTLAPAAVAARRLPPPLVLLAGIFAVLAGQVLALEAGSPPVLGAARVLQGAGAGAVLSAALALVWQSRSRTPLALFAGALCGSLALAVPLALGAVPREPGRWREALTPFPWLLGLALSCALLACLPGGAGRPLPPLRAIERTRLLLPLVPSAGFAFLAVTAVGASWEPGVGVLVAGLGITAFAGLALACTRDAALGGPCAPALQAVLIGWLVLPVAAPAGGLAFLTAAPAGQGAWPFAAAVPAALAGALCAARPPARRAVLAGDALLVLAVLLLLGAGPRAGAAELAACLALLGGGAGLALAASLRGAGPGAAQFALALCFPALLCGNLVAGSLQADRVRGADGAAAGLAALGTAQQTWLAAAGVLALALSALAAAVTRRRDMIGGDRLSGVSH